MIHELEVVHGNLFAFFNDDPKTIILHGVTKDRFAGAGFARLILDRFGKTRDEMVEIGEAHYGTNLGSIKQVVPRVYAGVTQPDYGRAEPHRITQVLNVMTSYMGTAYPDHTLLIPLIGGGLGGLGEGRAREAIDAAVLTCPTKLVLYQNNS